MAGDPERARLAGAGAAAADEGPWAYGRAAGEQGAPEPEGYPSAAFNMINSILGAGLVGLPYGFAQAGVPLGWIFFILFACLTCYTLEMLISVADRRCREGDTAVVAYEEVVASVLGERGRRLLLATQGLYAFGASVGYVIILKDALCTSMSHLTHNSFFDKKPLVTLVVSVAFLLPICSLRSVAALSHFSIVGFLAVVVIAVIVLVEFAVERDTLCDDSGAAPADAAAASGPACDLDYTTFARPSAIQVLGVFVFAFMCHHNQFPVYRSLGDKADPGRFAKVTRLSIAVCCVVTGCSSAVVYATYGQQTDSDFFTNYPDDSMVMNVGRLIFAFTMVVTYPMQFVVARESLQVVLVGIEDFYGRGVSGLSVHPTPKGTPDTPALPGGAARQLPAMDIQRVTTDAGDVPEGDAADGARPLLGSPGVPDGSGRALSGLNIARNRSTGGKSLRSLKSGASNEHLNTSFARSGRTMSRVGSRLDQPPPCASMSAAGGGVREQTPLRLHVSTTLALFVASVGLAISVDALGSVLNLVGATAGGLLSYVFPAAIQLRDARERGEEPLGGRAATTAVLIFGCVMVVVGIVTSVMDFCDVEIH